MKEVLKNCKDDIASIRKMKQLSPKTKIKVEKTFHKEKERENHAIFISDSES